MPSSKRSSREPCIRTAPTAAGLRVLVAAALLAVLLPGTGLLEVAGAADPRWELDWNTRDGARRSRAKLDQLVSQMQAACSAQPSATELRKATDRLRLTRGDLNGLRRDRSSQQRTIQTTKSQYQQVSTAFERVGRMAIPPQRKQWERQRLRSQANTIVTRNRQAHKRLTEINHESKKVEAILAKYLQTWGPLAIDQKAPGSTTRLAGADWTRALETEAKSFNTSMMKHYGATQAGDAMPEVEPQPAPKLPGTPPTPTRARPKDKPVSRAEPFRWYTRWSEAKAAAERQGKLILCMSTRPRCTLCNKFKTQTAPQCLRSLEPLAVGYVYQIFNPEKPGVDSVIRRNLPGATLMPLVGFLTTDMEWVHGFWGNQTVRDVQSHIRKTKAKNPQKTRD